MTVGTSIVGVAASERSEWFISKGPFAGCICRSLFNFGLLNR